MKKCEKCQLEYSESSGFCPRCEDPLIEAASSRELASPPVVIVEAPDETVEDSPIEAMPLPELTSPPAASVGEPVEKGEDPPIEALPSTEPVPPPVASAETPAEACSVCNAAIQPDWKFCKFCGHRVDESTVVSARPSEPSSAVSGTVPPDTSAPATPGPTAPKPAFPGPTLALSEGPPKPYVAKPGSDFSAEIAPAFRPTNCPACGHENYAGRQTCESCNIPLVPVKTRGGRKKAVAIIGIAAGILLVLALVAVGGLYFIGSTVTVQTNPADAVLLLDGREVGRTDAAGNFSIKRVRAGNHSLVVKKQGFADWNQTFSVSFAAFQTGLSVRLVPASWRMTVVSTPAGASVFVDGQPVGTTDFTTGVLELPQVTPGDHTVRVTAVGFLESTQPVSLAGDQKLTFTLTPEPAVNASAPEEKIKIALDGMAAAIRARSVDQLMGYYGESLSYYNERAATPKTTVRDEYTKTFGIYKSMDVQYSNVKVTLDPSGTSATVVFDNTFKYTADGNVASNGSAQMQLTMTKTGEAWLITGEKALKKK